MKGVSKMGHVPGMAFLKDRSHITNTVLLVTILFIGLLSFKNSFIQDDAFISFRYAQNWVKFSELTWNPGEPEKVEGYTNFLWVVIMAIPIRLGLDPVISSKIISIVFMTMTLLFTYKLGNLLLSSKGLAYLIMLLVGTHYTFYVYATGGLETQLQTMLLVICAYLIFLMTEKRSWTNHGLLLASLFFSFAILTRIDSTIILFVLFIHLFQSLIKHGNAAASFLKNTAVFLIPALLIVGTWIIWKIYYYHDVLPNTFYIKATGFSMPVIKNGIRYCYEYFNSYWQIPMVLIGMVSIKSMIKSKIGILLIACLMWSIYIIKIGGGFMEFRLLVPITPFIFIIYGQILKEINHKNITIAMSLMLFLGSHHHRKTFSGYYGTNGIESISELEAHVINKNQNWAGIGKRLNDLFGQCEKPVTIATTAAGAIPYYSNLKTIDMLGLNDKWIARNGMVLSTRTGHQKYATYDYLIQTKVNFVIGHPIVEPIDKTIKSEYSLKDLEQFRVFNAGDFPNSALKIVEIPVDQEYKMIILYFYHHDEIDEILKKENFKTHPVVDKSYSLNN